MTAQGRPSRALVVLLIVGGVFAVLFIATTGIYASGQRGGLIDWAIGWSGFLAFAALFLSTVFA